MSTPEDPTAHASIATSAEATSEGAESSSVAVPTALHGPAWEWGRRILIAAALAFGLWLLVLAAGRSETTLEQGVKDPRVVSRVPLPDAQAPRQSQVGIELQEGYEGTLFIAGTRIPDAQIDGAVDPSTLSKEEIEQYGVRPFNRNRIIFTPGKGKVFESLPLGEVVVTVQYHKDRQPNVGAGTASWTITVQ